jgi:hypothetical protein
MRASVGAESNATASPCVKQRHVVINLVSLVSVWGRNWCYSSGTVERLEEGSVVEIDSIHAVFTHVAENMIG